MKTTSRYSFAQVNDVGMPALVPGTLGREYVDLLLHSARGRKEPVSIRMFARWIDRRFGLNKPFAMDEGMLERLRSELTAGKFRSLSGKAYRSLGRQIPSDIFAIHARLVGKTPVVRRGLIDSHRYGRLRFMASLTPQTQKALRWFHEKGIRPKPNGTQQMLTQATRDGSLSAALWLLQVTGLRGLELITKEHVNEVLPDPDHDDPEFRKTSRWLHGCKPVYKACVHAGLLPANPLADFSSSMFGAYACRDFLPPGEVDRVRDLSSVNMDDWQQVRDRLTVMLLIDTALRKGELAGIRLADVKATDDGAYQIRLDSSVQKMVGKPVAFIGTLYPETATLLRQYLTKVRPKFEGATMLMVDCKGEDAGPEAIYEAVVREGARLGLKCYHSGKRPGCHALRRTFATINSAPLGLGLSTAELAERMRTSYDVVHEHYVVRNVLRSAMNEEVYRQRLTADPVRQGLNHVDGLARLGIDVALLDPVRSKLEAMRQPAPIQMNAEPREWIAEESVHLLLREAWGTLPKVRTFRGYMKRKGYTCRMGNRGGLHMDANQVKSLVSSYVPLADILPDTPQINPAQEGFPCESIGRLHLVRRMDVAELLRKARLRRDGKPDGSANCQTGGLESVKQAPERGFMHARKIA